MVCLGKWPVYNSNSKSYIRAPPAACSTAPPPACYLLINPRVVGGGCGGCGVRGVRGVLCVPRVTLRFES